MRSFWHTRPRVQRAPGIPCALCFEGEDNEFAKLGRNTPRECGRTPSLRRPCESRDPYAAAEIVRTRWSTALLQQLRPVVMGPCVRRDDKHARQQAAITRNTATCSPRLR